MFRWLLKPKFFSKCISDVKCIKIRLETIEKKKKAMQKFMKNDIAELLKSGLDNEAYKRAERLSLEQNMLSCYEFIAKFIECISDHVQDLTKQRECPEECKEAVPSLMYAAARFADLPELRDLRTLFIEKFGNSLEPYVNKEFVEKLRRDPPTREMKIRLLYDIAQEFSIEWDDRALGQRLYPHPSIYDEKPEHDKTDNVVTEIEYKDTSKVKERDTKSKGRKDLKDEKSWMHLNSSSDDETSTDNSSHDGKKGSSSSIGSISLSEEDEPETTKKPTSYWFLQPPYLKNNAKKPTDSSEALHKTEPDHYVLQEKTTARSVRRSRAKTIESVYDSKTKDAETLGSVEMKTGNRKSYPSEQPEYESRRRNTSRTSYVRGMSLPTEHTNAEETSNSKGHARGVSLDSQMRGGAGRVYPHPNMLDWDDLVARLAALKGK